MSELLRSEQISKHFGMYPVLSDISFSVYSGEILGIIGPNGAGKTTLMECMMGLLPVDKGNLYWKNKQISPLQSKRFMFYLPDGILPYAKQRVELVLKFFRKIYGAEKGLLETLSNRLGLSAVFKKEVRTLSKGYRRRLLLAIGLLSHQPLLMLDEPFDGLDASHRRTLGASLDALMAQNLQIILVSHRVDEIPEKITRIIALKDGRILGQGSRETMLSHRHLASLYGSATDRIQAVSKKNAPIHTSPHPIIDVRSATVRYGNIIVFKDLSWKVCHGEHWAISGPNGSGKTTLLRLVTGDHLQAYANEIYIFGRQRGTGESIWEIKKYFGVVSAELQRNYRKRIPALDVVRSGFFDSIGLYQTCTDTQRAIVDDWITRFKLSELMHRRYDLLSFGERKMVLIARAMVKSPAVLILDEPCQGLDPANRRNVLSLVDQIGHTTDTQILFVTHRPDEVPTCTTHWLKMPGPSTGAARQPAV